MTPAPRRRCLEIEDIGDIVVIKFVERRVLEDHDRRIRRDLSRLVDELGRRKLVLDFGPTEYCCSSVLDHLLTLHQNLRLVGGKLALFRIAPAVREAIAIRKLDDHLFIAEPTIPTVGAVLGEFFRPMHAVCAREWRTDTAIALARTMYQTRDFSAMPILADTLQDAGCDDTDILDHCRGDGPHVRGCWVVDLVLGKE